MIRFHAAPAVPADYPRLQSLSPDEIGQARPFGYVADTVNPAAPVERAGRDITFDPLPGDTLDDWRTRMYILWFCYIYENLAVIQCPMGAIDELILEFRALEVIDVPGRRLASLYAGVGWSDPLTASELKAQTEELHPHYAKAVALLAGAAIDQNNDKDSLFPIRISPTRK